MFFKGGGGQSDEWRDKMESQGGSMDLHLHYISMLKPEHCMSEVWVLQYIFI